MDKERQSELLDPLSQDPGIERQGAEERQENVRVPGDHLDLGKDAASVA